MGCKCGVKRWLENLYIEHDDLVYKWVRLFSICVEGQGTKSLLSQLDKSIENDEKIFRMLGGVQNCDYLKVEDVAKKY